MTPLTRAEALTIMRQEISRIAPDADVDAVPTDAPFREVLELDSLDFLNLVEVLIERTGARIDEEDYASLRTLSGSADFLVARTADRAAAP
ncbi:acyl carrier protein [Streptomyces purpurogeneiscleroticus]|uniref:acyl carrier protein n=1 Tax=Streptomyces purpurogeneiscleroticus TaxID=68259 RepID=UPI001CC003B0|nr:acyl carrier protein [Streptomyces purpurogeneiscleroticus]MBZ4019633.1 phosphopantetheine-binding protein [Streptomyces purpurogeneiscleroticus]